MRTRHVATRTSVLAACWGAVAACSSSGTASRLDAGADAANADASGDAAPLVDAGTDAVIELPRPTGPYAIGTQRREVVDTSRPDRQAPDPMSSRTLLVTLFYPTDPGTPGQLAPYMMPAEALTLSTYTTQGWVQGGSTLQRFPSGWEKYVVAHGRDSVPLSSDGAKFPVVLFSHGFTDSVPVYTSLIEELASNGFVVAAISHTYDADITEFPDGAVANPNTPWEFANGTVFQNFDAHTSVWVADAHFVLDQLTAWNASDSSQLVSGRLDLDQVGYFGHSFGGSSAAEECALDPRLKAGINLDGPFFSPTRLDGGRPIPTPFMIQLNMLHGTQPMEGGIAGQDFSYDQSVQNTFRLLEDAGYEVRIANSMHNTFCDVPMLADRFDGPEAGQSLGGTIDPLRAISIINAYDLAFFQKHLKGMAEPLLEGATPYPEVTFMKR